MDMLEVARNILGVTADVCSVYLFAVYVSTWLKGMTVKQ